MMPASKHGDPQLGIDIHLCIVPPSPSPVPLPTPHISVVFDPFDYVPFIGATVTVCGMKRATAGTGGLVIHIPPGFPFAPKFPAWDDELFMGSATVVADGDPFSFIALPVLGCQIVGMPSIPRLKKKGKRIMLLPTTFNLAIPTSVFVGGPPTISMLGLAFKGAFAALGKFAKSGLFKRIRQKLFGGLKDGFLKCVILRAEPVNILTGEVSVRQEDFSLPGCIPIEWNRAYTSGSDHEGLCGHGWETPGDTRLEIDPIDGIVCMRHPMVGPLFFGRLPIAIGDDAGELEMVDGALLTDEGDEYRVRTKEDRVYHFPKVLAQTNQRGGLEYPIRRIADLCGNWLDFERRGGVLTAINESAGRCINIGVVDGRIREVALTVPGTDVHHTFVRYEYDDAGDLVAVVDALGHPYRFAYEEHHLVRHSNRNGLSFYYEYDKDGEDWRVVHAWGDGGLYNYTFEYNDVLKERRITDSLGQVSTVTLDDRGLPICEIDPLEGRTLFEYDDAGRTTAVVDAAMHRTEYAYDERGNLLCLTRPDGNTVRNEFDARDKVVTITDPNGDLWRQTWDERGLLVEQRSPLGNISRCAYGKSGQLAVFVNGRGARTELVYDGFGNVSELWDAHGHRTAFTYDLFGNVLTRVDPLLRQTAFSYDADGQVVKVTLPSGATISCSYDAEGNLSRYVDENGAVTRLEHAGLGEITRRIHPDGTAVEFMYDTEERLIGLRNQRGEVYRIMRDALGRTIEEVDYWGQTRRFAYDASGALRASIDPLGRRVEYLSDPLGRVVKRILPDAEEECFAYDANGNLVEARNRHGSIARTFDADGRLVRERQGEDAVVASAYDAAGNRVERRTSDGAAVAYEYDLVNRVIGIRIDDIEAVRLERDAAGQVTREILGGGLSRDYRYTADGMVAAQVAHIARAPLFAVRYDYDLVGNLTRRIDSEYGTDRYSHDPLGRVLEHIDPYGRVARYLNDEAGDRLRTAVVQGTIPAGPRGAHDNWQRVADHQGTRYRFDRAGNLVERAGPERTVRFAWDANQRLVESDRDGVATSYGYDPLGRRLFKQTGSVRTRFLWDGDALGAERTPNASHEYVYYPDSFEPVARVDQVPSGGEPQLQYFHNDPNGCPVRMSGASGAMTWAASYSAWGKAEPVDGSSLDNRIRLQGQYEDQETDLHYSRFRYFDPTAGQFAGQDPLRYNTGANLYAFLPNVQGWIDPLGLSCTTIVPGQGKLQALAKQIREAASDAPARNQRTIAVGMDAEGRLFAGSSNWFDPGQKAMADALGIKMVKGKTGKHAEENLLREVADLKAVGTSKRWPCGPDEHNCAQQLIDRGVILDNVE